MEQTSWGSTQQRANWNTDLNASFIQCINFKAVLSRRSWWRSRNLPPPTFERLNQVVVHKAEVWFHFFFFNWWFLLLLWLTRRRAAAAWAAVWIALHLHFYSPARWRNERKTTKRGWKTSVRASQSSCFPHLDKIMIFITRGESSGSQRAIQAFKQWNTQREMQSDGTRRPSARSSSSARYWSQCWSSSLMFPSLKRTFEGLLNGSVLY